MKLNEVQIVEHLSNSEFISVIMNDGSIGRIRKDKLLGTINHAFAITSWETKGWHRIAICTASNATISSAVVSVGNTYSSIPTNSSCFYYSGSGYGGRVVSMIGKVGTIFNKVRVIYKESTSDTLYIDVHYNFDKRNNVFLSASTIINLEFTFQGDDLAIIPAGFSVQEFDL